MENQHKRWLLRDWKKKDQETWSNMETEWLKWSLNTAQTFNKFSSSKK